MSGITLSAATRQNLLVAQDTASLLATTQNRLATGKKVNSALDNPTTFFTAQGLNSRATDLSNLLDGISNGVQVIQQANNGITSLQKLLDSAKSVANQALQSTTGYSTKSNISTTITGATASDLRGTSAFANAVAAGGQVFTGAAGGATSATSSTKLGSAAVATLTGTAVTGLTGTSTLSTLTTAPVDGDTLSVNGKTITFRAAAVPTTSSTPPIPAGSGASGNIVTDGSGNSTVYLGASGTPTGTVTDLLNAIDIASGAQTAVINTSTSAAALAASTGQTASSIATNTISLKSSTGADLSVTGKADLLKSLGLTTATGSNPATVSANRVSAAGQTASLIQDGSTLNVNGKTITFKNAQVPAAANAPTGSGVTGNVMTDGNGNSTVYLQSATLADVTTAVDLATGAQTAAINTGAATLTTATGLSNSTVAGGTLQLNTGTVGDLNITGSGNALSALGLGGNTGSNSSFTASRASTPGGISGKTLTFGSLNGGTALNVTFGDGTNGTVKTLDQLNAKLSLNNLTATVDSNGKLLIQTTNDYAASTIGSTADGGAVGGTSASLFSTAAAPVADANSQATRASLLNQYNQILDNISSTAKDASYNGVNLLNGDTLQLTFNEKASSRMSLQGVTFSSDGLGLSKLGLNGASEFEDNQSTNKVLANLSDANNRLRAASSTFGSNLSVVQTRQDFNKQVINALQTGASNLTDADLNEEAANSQALSTRQSLTVSALSLANQSQQSILQLLR